MYRGREGKTSRAAERLYGRRQASRPQTPGSRHVRRHRIPAADAESQSLTAASAGAGSVRTVSARSYPSAVLETAATVSRTPIQYTPYPPACQVWANDDDKYPHQSESGYMHEKMDEVSRRVGRVCISASSSGRWPTVPLFSGAWAMNGSSADNACCTWQFPLDMALEGSHAGSAQD